LAKETLYSIEMVEKKFMIKTNKNAYQSEFFLLATSSLKVRGFPHLITNEGIGTSFKKPP
jgi:hypothetical protein